MMYECPKCMNAMSYSDAAIKYVRSGAWNKEELLSTMIELAQESVEEAKTLYYDGSADARVVFEEALEFIADTLSNIHEVINL